MRFLTYCLSILSCLLVVGCASEDYAHHGVNIIEDSDLLAIYERDGYDEVYISNRDGREVAHYVLVDKDNDSVPSLPEGAEVIKVPLESLILDSEVYAAALEELKADEIISGVFDAQYITSDKLSSRIRRGEIADIGLTSSPNTEKILALAPEAVLVSFFEGMPTQGLDKMGIPVIKMFDLQEESPLGRAEWIRLIGRLSGREQEADDVFDEMKANYSSLKDNISRSDNDSVRPKVLTEIVYNGTWSVPGGKSYQAQLISDAGGAFFREADQSPVSVNLSPEQVLAEGKDADVWIIRFFGDEKDLKNILAQDPNYKEFKAFKSGNIYFSDTSKSAVFREFPFHPDLLLKDYEVIFSGDSITPLRYFKKLSF